MTLRKHFSIVFPLAAILVAYSVPLASAQAATEAGALQGSSAAAAAKPTPGKAVSNSAAGVAQKLGQATQQTATPAQTEQTPSPVPQQQLPQIPAQAVEQGAPLRVMVGKSVLMNTTAPLKRVSVTDPNVADALVVTPTQVLVHGRAPGEISLILWDEQERSRAFDLRVDVDATAAAEEVKAIFPDERIKVTSSRNAVVLSGHVSTKEAAERAGLLAGAYSKNVINVLTFGAVGSDQVMLEVKFAEVDRTALSQFGFNLFSTGATNTIGVLGTQQFGSFGQQKITDVFPLPKDGRTPFTSEQTINDVLNIFLFRPDIHLGTVIKALQQKNVLQILAEPNLIAVNGKEASFLAGGEFPFPIIQGGANNNAVTIQFKEFGVRLKFMPTIMPGGSIRLHVAPEVSALDFSNSLTLQGFVIPALSTRRAETEIELQDGSSFVMAGLLDNRVTNISSKVPGLGDIPILGNLFKSKSYQKSKTELMVLVTAHKVVQAPPAVPPTFPKEFLDPKKFDEKTDNGGGHK